MEETTEDNYSDLFLKDSFNYGLYKNLTRNDINYEDNRYCSNNKRKFKGNREIYNLCNMYAKNLKQLSTIMEEEKDSKQHCRYLTFWLNDNISNIFKTHQVPKEDHNKIIQGFSSVSHLVNGGLSKPHCDYYYDKGITMEIWKKWKDLYDYIINRNHIQKVINTSKDLCEKYSTYYSYIKEIYSDYEKECCIKQYGNCPEYLDFREWCNDDNVLNKLSCAHSHHDDATPVKSPEDVAGEEQVAEEASEGNKEDKGQQAQSQGIGGEALSVGSEGGLFLTEIDVRGGHLDTEVTESLGNKQFGTEDNNGESSNYNASNHVRTITYTSLGLVLPLATLYRFTPLGSWVNTKILGKNKLMENMRNNNYELLLNDIRNSEMSLNDTTYSISYNSAAK
ncbi:variable surface protein Vir22, putative [Plasmodium vivax]|uniref:Variable surface protein Vir22, putative n=1 Tax=Plasmodium vivax (strain Salvador I) TaxID=126793 RepID=A5KD05_PLAVS|nr:variable surface protein Vir22, putative [Plasmodium vivax]EDL42763.1 variable surface protein Vir22, putative [Plasmodium vivax]|eukprot:XP_001612556.1 variable surface protein Vir22 [Plasmodium vivax Sal-1]